MDFHFKRNTEPILLVKHLGQFSDGHEFCRAHFSLLVPARRHPFAESITSAATALDIRRHRLDI
jgi:hypothetical protein